jgi:hypothetical protein
MANGQWPMLSAEGNHVDNKPNSVRRVSVMWTTF